MRASNFACLAIPAIVAASPPVHAPAQNLDKFLAERRAELLAPAWPLVTTIPTPSPTPSTTPAELEEEPNPLELRQAAGNDNLGAVLTQATQNAVVTTQWVESTILSTTTWVEVVYTQTFASVVEQQNTAGAGSIGLGTHTGTVGVVKASGAVNVMPSGSLVTIAMGTLGVLAGMGMVLL